MNTETSIEGYALGDNSSLVSFVHIMAALLGRRRITALYECFLLFVMLVAHCLHARKAEFSLYFSSSRLPSSLRHSRLSSELLVPHIMQTAFNELAAGSFLVNRVGVPHVHIEYGTWTDMPHGQRALRLWLELIAFIEHFSLSFCISCTHYSCCRMRDRRRRVDHVG